MTSRTLRLLVLAALTAACGLNDPPPPPAQAPAEPTAAAPSTPSASDALPAPTTGVVGLLSDPAPSPDPRGTLTRPPAPPAPALTPEEDYGRRIAAQREYRRYIDSVRAQMDKDRDKSVLLTGATAPMLAEDPGGGTLGIVEESAGVWSGLVGGPDSPGTAVWEDAAPFKKGWAALTTEDAPAVDFKAVRAGAVFLGRKPTGGWRARFITASEDGDSLAVTWAEEGPRVGRAPPPGETSPFVVFLLPREPKAVVFRRSEGPKKK